jgi:hypothetical protein
VLLGVCLFCRIGGITHYYCTSKRSDTGRYLLLPVFLYPSSSFVLQRCYRIPIYPKEGTMSSNDDDKEDKNKTADAILEMLREAGVSTKSLEEKKHAFWDTQVGYL